MFIRFCLVFAAVCGSVGAFGDSLKAVLLTPTDDPLGREVMLEFADRLNDDWGIEARVYRGTLDPEWPDAVLVYASSLEGAGYSEIQRDTIRAYVENGGGVVAVYGGVGALPEVVSVTMDGVGLAEPVLNATIANIESPLLANVSDMRFQSPIVRVSGLSDAAVLLDGSAQLAGLEPLDAPVAWTAGAHVFATTLGDAAALENGTLQRLLVNAVHWAAGRPIPESPAEAPEEPPVPEGSFAVPVRFRLPVESGGEELGPQTVDAEFDTADTAIVICDMWDRHWCRGASERVDAMAPGLNEVIEAARSKGVTIIHAPSGTMHFYAGMPQRLRMQFAPEAESPEPLELPDQPLPIDDSDEGCTTPPDEPFGAWTRQHPGISMGEHDGISDDGMEVYSYFSQRGIENVVYVGVHTNMCVLDRSFAIKAMARRGLKCYLIRDLTDTMYNPAMPPYVSHDRGTELVVEHIERYWAPTMTSEDLKAALGG